MKSHPRMNTMLPVLLGLALMFPQFIGAQCERPIRTCSTELTEFLMDSQPLSGMVKEGGSVQFKMRLYEGFLYRVVACTDVPGAQIR